MIDPAKLPEMAEALAEENFDFRDFIKHRTRLSSNKIDALVFRISDQVWKTIDCTACGNCCRVVSPMLKPGDVERLACGVGSTPEELTSKHLEPAEGDPESPWAMRERPCPFLRDNRCSVYEHRPDTCRGYPYLDKPDFIFRTLSMMGRLSECPAVFEVWEKLKVATGFRARRR